MKKDVVLAIVAAMVGIGTWFLVMKLGHRREAWDSSLYWTVSLPAMVLTSAVLAWIEPRNAWRWAVIPFAAQFVWMVATQEVGSLWPMGMVMFGVLSIPSLLVAKAISWRRAPEPASEE